MMIACHFDPSSRRSKSVAKSMALGAKALGIPAKAVAHFASVEGDVCIAYGWGNPGLFDAYRRHGGKYVYVDLGWWGRKPATDVLGGYHKVVVNGREPNAYFRANMPGDRFAHTGLQIAPWRQYGHHLLVAGMSEKSARTRGWEPQQWETATIKELAQIYPFRPILYRPKPSWTGAWPIPGAAYSPATVPIEDALLGCFGVVACHSNVSVDALLAGIPMWVGDGVAREFNTRIDQFDNFERRDDRQQLMNDIAYVQWTTAEMASGACLRHLMEHASLCD